MAEPEWACAGCDLVTGDWDVMDAHALAVAGDPVLLAAHRARVQEKL